MTWPTRLAAAVLTLAFASGAVANQWNDRTQLSFDAPIMIPGATLPPGNYVFRLMDSPVFRHMVQIWNEEETKLIATVQAIPTKRIEMKGDVVVKLNPTAPGSAVALKSWFYPGTLYGRPRYRAVLPFGVVGGERGACAARDSCHPRVRAPAYA